MTVDLSGVPQTLFLPLHRRARWTKVGNPILEDPFAVELVTRARYDFAGLDASFRPTRDLAWVARPWQFDRRVRRFQAQHPKGVVVNLGAGLDTSFSRLDDGRLRWFDLDLPEVIEIRRSLIPETERSRCIARSLFDPSWMAEIGDPEDGVCLLSAGCLFYFTEADLRPFFAAVHQRLPGAELVFDAVTPMGLDAANKMMEEAGVGGARLKWALKDPQELERWGVGISQVQRIPLFSAAPRTGLPLKARWFMFLMDLTRASAVIRCRA
ncbi:MAG: class I SAM-dependent methyltransferase [Myxococcales bacterium]